MNKLEKTVKGLRHKLKLESNAPLVAALRPAYDFMLGRKYGKQGISRVINCAEEILLRPGHRYVHEDYEAPVYEYLKANIRPGAVILDVGAHIGIFTILLARWAGTEGRVYAFEPTPATFAALNEHLQMNGVAGQVTPVPRAVSDKPGAASFYAVSNSPENTLNQTHSRLGAAAALEVQVTTIDSFCADNNLAPALIKIDIEGFELHALRGARATIERCKPLLVVEMHPMNWPDINLTPEQVEAELTDLGLRAVALEKQRDPLREYGHVVLLPR